MFQSIKKLISNTQDKINDSQGEEYFSLKDRLKTIWTAPIAATYGLLRASAGAAFFAAGAPIALTSGLVYAATKNEFIGKIANTSALLAFGGATTLYRDTKVVLTEIASNVAAPFAASYHALRGRDIGQISGNDLSTVTSGNLDDVYGRRCANRQTTTKVKGSGNKVAPDLTGVAPSAVEDGGISPQGSAQLQGEGRGARSK